MILDTVADIVATEGVSCVTMERICQEAGISKTLIYKYFSGPNDLLTQLLERELKSLRMEQIEGAAKAETFEDLVRSSTHLYLNYIAEKGLIIDRLQADPNLLSLSNPTYYGRDAVVDNLSPAVAEHFGLPLEIARAATDVSFGLPSAAGEYLLRGKLDRQQLEDLTVSMIIGSFVMARNEYLTTKQKWPRKS